MTTPPNPSYPLQVEIDYPDRLSRLLIFVKWLLVIPHYIALLFLGIGAYVVWIVSFFAVLITGRYPEGMFNYLAGVLRWSVRVSAYQFFLTDAYPPFSLDDDPDYPARLRLEYPAKIARWRPLVNWLLAIPVLIGAVIILVIADVAIFIAWFAILITGRIPAGLFDVIVIFLRWQSRANVFFYWMTEAYPPLVWA